MRRFVTRGSLSLTLALLLLIGAALLVGLRQPPSGWEALLKLNECALPCWVGIVPGQTSFEDAQVLVQQAYGDAAAYTLEDFRGGQFSVTDARTHDRIAITLDAGDAAGERYTIPPTVQQIILWADVVPNRRMDFFDLYSAMGAPEDLQATSLGGAPYLMLFYRRQHVGLATNAGSCNAVSPAQKIYQIILSARTIPAYYGWASASTRWLGFRRCHVLPSPIAP